MNGMHCYFIMGDGEFCCRAVTWEIKCPYTGEKIYTCDGHHSKFMRDHNRAREGHLHYICTKIINPFEGNNAAV